MRTWCSSTYNASDLKYQQRCQEDEFAREERIDLAVGRLECAGHQWVDSVRGSVNDSPKSPFEIGSDESLRCIPTHIVNAMEVMGNSRDSGRYYRVVHCYAQSRQAQDDGDQDHTRELESLARILGWLSFFVCR
jgi:hypothetical protein